MFKRFFLFSFFFFLFSFFHTQNLVPNPSFEIYDTCPTFLSQIKKAVPWFQPKTDGGSSDYFNKCSSGNSGVPQNNWGYQDPNIGNAYTGVILWDGANFREYLEVKLDSSLKPGKRYCVSFHVSLYNNAKYAIDAVGIYFSSDSVKTSTWNNLPYIPQVSNSTGTMLSDTLNWILVSDTITATGGERFITIGNFKTDAQTNTVILNNNGSKVSYYYIDDVSVTPCDSGVGIERFKVQSSEFNVYPNPGNEILLIRYRLQENSHLSVSAYDVLGHKVADIINENQLAVERELAFDVSEIPAGVYFLISKLNGIAVQTEKIIIIK